MLHKHRLNTKNGSYTVELSLLTPVIVAIFLFILFSAYYMHDRVIIEKNCYISALRASLCMDEYDREYIAYNTFEKETASKILGKWNMEKEYSKNGDIISFSVKGNMVMNEGLLRKIIGEKMFVYETECSANIANETSYLRNNRRAK